MIKVGLGPKMAGIGKAELFIFQAEWIHMGLLFMENFDPFIVFSFKNHDYG